MGKSHFMECISANMIFNPSACVIEHENCVTCLDGVPEFLKNDRIAPMGGKGGGNQKVVPLPVQVVCNPTLSGC
jgi:hypothetical protein